MTTTQANQPVHTDTPPSSPAAGLFWFVLFATVAAGMLAAAVLGPEYVQLADLQARRDGLAHQADCEDRLAAYNHKLIEALRDDPVLRTRMLIRHGNFRPAGLRAVQVDPASVELPAPRRIGMDAQRPQVPPQDNWLAAAEWIAQPTMRSCFLAGGLVLLAATVILFGPSRRAPARG